MNPESTATRKKTCLFQDAFYISPELDRDELEDFIDTLGEHKNFLVQINKLRSGYTS